MTYNFNPNRGWRRLLNLGIEIPIHLLAFDCIVCLLIELILDSVKFLLKMIERILSFCCIVFLCVAFNNISFILFTLLWYFVSNLTHRHSHCNSSLKVNWTKINKNKNNLSTLPCIIATTWSSFKLSNKLSSSYLKIIKIIIIKWNAFGSLSNHKKFSFR